MFNFLKIHACGNNFLIFFVKKNKKELKKILNKINIFCDQLLIIKKISFYKKIIHIKIYNNNLNLAKNCGNGIRCLSWYYLKYLKKKKIINFKLEKNFIYAFKNKKNFFTIYKFPKSYKIILRINNLFFKVCFINLINFHLILIIKNIKSIFLKKIYNLIKKFFNDVYNIEFLQLINKNNIYIRIFEKDVGETLSCGSGIMSSCFFIFKKYKKNNFFKINSIGGVCFVFIKKNIISIFGNVNFCFLGVL